MAQLNREELVRLVRQIMLSSGCMIDLDGLLNKFEASVEYPNAGELIFNPPDGKRLTPEEVVDIALAHRSDKPQS